MRIAAAVLLVSTLACSDTEPDAPASAELAALLGDPSAHLFHVGAVDTPAAKALSIVLSARIAPDGEHVALVDRTEPFVRVFDRQGRVRSAFLTRGGGPGEARNPYGIGISRSGRVLVLDMARMSIFDLDGTYLGGGTVPALRPASATAGCDDAWVVHGFFASSAGPGRGSGWLHAVAQRPEGEMSARTLYSDEAELGHPGWGGMPDLVGGDGRILFYHKRADPRSLVELSCTDGSARVLPESALLFPAVKGGERVEQRGNTQRMSVAAGTPIFGGLGIVSDGLVLGEITPGGAESGGTTRLRLAVRDSVFEAVVPGAYVILDSRPGDGLLFRAMEPVPHVFMVPEAALLRAIRGAASLRTARRE